jgi:FAD/FMN-containing dehydrogenase
MGGKAVAAPWLAALFALLLAARSQAGPVVNDVTRLNPVAVEAVASPTTLPEIQALVSQHKGPISIGGARHSQGGQTACRGCLFIDMRRFDHILALDPAHRTITVEPGVTWRAIQTAIDRRGLAVKIMQDYSNFTVGGTLSVNAHGSYATEGPVINSVRAIKLVLADGRVVVASRTENPELFYGAIGGYGGLGVIVEATLDLASDSRLERVSHRMPAKDYPRFFAEAAKSDKLVMLTAALYPPRFEQVNAIAFSETSKPLTIPDHFASQARPSAFDLMLLDFVTKTSIGKWWRQYVYDAQHLGRSEVMLRNYVASQDANSIEPASRSHSTYVLQEYFVPVERFGDFVPKMAAILKDGHANVLNIAIRHSPAEPDTLLSWAPREVFCFVLYYEQGVTPADGAAVRAWTGRLIQLAIDEGGDYYLPYQVIATRAQFLKAYPRAQAYFALKRRLDPGYKFRNELLEAYYRP